ncbi:MAG: hypothetical protein ACRD2D_06750, partial [Terriglobales bacterium]
LLARRALGIRIDGRAGLHVYFLIRALERLAPGGRCAFIVPADIAEGVFARSLWEAITERFRLERVVTFAPTAAPFPGVDTNALIVMLTRTRPGGRVQWERRLEPGVQGKTESQERSLDELLRSGLSRPLAASVEPGYQLEQFVRVVRGIATGANEFFFLTADEIEKRRLPLHVFLRAVGRTRDVQGEVIATHDLARLDAAGRPTYLLALDGGHVSPAIKRYLDEGEAKGLPERALLATRRPWYKMERREPPAILFAYLGRRQARFIRNEAKTVPLTGFLCVYPIPGVAVGRLWEVLRHPATIANLARVGKSYGDGAIKVEPRALEKLTLPAAVCSEAGLVPAGQMAIGF